MKVYPYLIVGGGMAADAAAKAIRKSDPGSTVGLISAEVHPPYKRPPLTKKLWQGKDYNTIWLKTAEKGAEILLDTQVTRLDPQARRVETSGGEQYGYEKLLLATGGVVNRLPFGPEGILYYRTATDYLALRRAIEEKNRIAVIGGGFIGSELAAGLRMNGKEVTLVFPEPGITSNVFPLELSEYINDYYRNKGVTVLNGRLVRGLEQNRDGWVLSAGDEEISADVVVAGIGIKPNTDLASAAGLKVDNGIWVDEYLRTSLPDIYAAGDTASIYNAILGKRMRYEHEDNAVKMGDAAGKNMTGQAVRYDEYLPFFYSDLFDLGYEAVGILDARLETRADWQEKYKKGVIYYLDEGRVKGVLLWNVWGALEAAREVIRQSHAAPVATDDLVGRIQ